MFEFDNKVVAVTGAAGGIGAAIAKAFSKRGATVALIDRNKDVSDAAKILGENHKGYCIDLADITQIKNVFAGIEDDLGAVDILINNAGIGGLAPAFDMTVENWNNTLAINLTASFFCAQAVAPGMQQKRWGRIISIASQAAVIGIEDHAAYCASKSGLLGMTHCLAIEWGPHQITVNCISPTVVETELALKHWGGENGEIARKAIPSQRFARPDEVASAAIYLASNGAAMVNGTNLMLDGGNTVR